MIVCPRFVQDEYWSGWRKIANNQKILKRWETGLYKRIHGVSYIRCMKIILWRIAWCISITNIVIDLQHWLNLRFARRTLMMISSASHLCLNGGWQFISLSLYWYLKCLKRKDDIKCVSDMIMYLQSNGITIWFSCLYTSQKNGKAKLSIFAPLTILFTHSYFKRL